MKFDNQNGSSAFQTVARGGTPVLAGRGRKDPFLISNLLMRNMRNKLK